MGLGVKSLTNNEYLLLVMAKASQVSFALPFPSMQEDGVAHQLLHVCLTSGVPKATHADEGREFTAEVFKRCLDYRERIFSPHSPTTPELKDL